MAICSNCGTQNADGTKFCTNCGAELPKLQTEPKTDSILEDAKEASIPDIPQRAAGEITMPTVSEPQIPVNPPLSTQKTNGLCIGGFVTSLVSILCCGITAIIGLILSIIGAVSAKKKKEKGMGLAIAGIIISSILLIIGLITFCVRADYILKKISNNDWNFSDIAETYDDYDDEDNYYKNQILDTKWCETTIGSCLVFNTEKNTFKYYSNYLDGVLENEDANEYYTGVYEVYTGDEAVDKITTTYSDYGISRSELNNTIRAQGAGYNLDNAVLLVLHNEQFITNGENTLDEPSDTVLIGYINPMGNVLSVSNMVNYTFVPSYSYTPADWNTTNETTDITYETTENTTESTEMTEETTEKTGPYLTSVGNDATGTVALTGDWVGFSEIGGFSSQIVEHEQTKNLTTGSIIGLYVLNVADDVTPEKLAQAGMYNMEVNNGATNVTGAHVTIGGYDAIQTYGLYPDNTMLVTWYFRGNDNKIRMITVEFSLDHYDDFSMVESNYSLN